MTANEMRNLFKELYDGASAIEMGYDDKEVSRFLNLAQDIIIKEKFFTTHNRFLEGFETSSNRDAELSNLKLAVALWQDKTDNNWYIRYKDGNFNEIREQVNVIEDDTINFPAVLFNKPNYILFIVNDNVDLKDDDGVLYRNIPIKSVNEDNINDILNNPFMKPDVTVVYRSYQTVTNLNEENYTNSQIIKLYLPENFKFNRWNAVVFRRPRRIRVDILNPDNQIHCEINDYVHNDIVQKAVELALGAIGSAKWQISGIENQKNIQ